MLVALSLKEKLRDAAENGRVDEVKELIEQKVNVNAANEVSGAAQRRRKRVAA